MITKRISLTTLAAVFVTVLGATAAFAGDGEGGNNSPYQFGGALWQPPGATARPAQTGQSSMPSGSMMGSNGMMGQLDQAQKTRMIEMCNHMVNEGPVSSPGSHMMAPNRG
jgi:hypothetical protein